VSVVPQSCTVVAVPTPGLCAGRKNRVAAVHGFGAIAGVGGAFVRVPASAPAFVAVPMSVAAVAAIAHTTPRRDDCKGADVGSRLGEAAPAAMGDVDREAKRRRVSPRDEDSAAR
jgi:hypothetical protein